MDVLTMDWSGLVLTAFLIYGIYAPCLLIMLDRQHRLSARLLAILPCLLLSWFGYWLSQRHLRYSDSV